MIALNCTSFVIAEYGTDVYGDGNYGIAAVPQNDDGAGGHGSEGISHIKAIIPPSTAVKPTLEKPAPERNSSIISEKQNPSRVKPKQLFDITFNIQDVIISNSSQLEAIVTFESFGTEPTQVSAIFIVKDDAGQEIYRDNTSLTVAVQEVLHWKYGGSALPEGQYSVILQTAYGEQVLDSFTQDFEVSGDSVSFIDVSFTSKQQHVLLLIVVIITATVFWVWYFAKKRTFATGETAPACAQKSNVEQSDTVCDAIHAGAVHSSAMHPNALCHDANCYVAIHHDAVQSSITNDALQTSDVSEMRYLASLYRIDKGLLLTAAIIVLIIMMFAFFVLEGNATLTRNSQMYTTETREYLDQRSNTLFLEINGFPRNAGYDLLFLRGLSSLKEFVAAQNKTTGKAKINLEHDFARFMNENKAYSQLRYIDWTGREEVGVVFNGMIYAATPDSLLDRNDTQFTKRTATLDDGEIYITQLSFNGGNDFTSQESNVTLPIMSYSTPVFDNTGERDGILVMTVNANYFLEDIRRAKREGETVFLINNKGHYLAHPDREKELGGRTTKDFTIYDDYPPEIADIILHDATRRIVENDEYIFTYRNIYPTIGNPDIYKGSEKIYGKNSEKEYYWVLVMVSDKKTLNGAVEDLQRANIIALVFSGMMLIIIIGLMLALHSHNNRRRI